VASMSSSTGGPAAWSAASACTNSEVSPASGASSGFDSDSSPSSVTSSSCHRPGPPPAVASCSHLGARPKAGRHTAVPPPPPPPISRLSCAVDQLLDGAVSPPWLPSDGGGGSSAQYADHSRIALSNGCGLDGGGDCDQPCNQSGTKRMRRVIFFS
jgi:hypothetical protein